MKKQTKMIITGLVILGLVAILGGKLYMENQEKKLLEQEKQIALQAKDMFKDIKEIDVKSVSYNSSTGITYSALVVLQGSGNKFNTVINLGEADFISGSEAITQQGKTISPIKLVFSNKKEEVIK